MGTELTFQTSTLYAFMLVLARVSGAFIFVPLPGIKAGPEVARAALGISITLALYPRWPVIDGTNLGILRLVGWMMAEAGLGIAVGVTVAFISEIFQMGAQIVGLQAGYSFSSTIDPNSGADSTVLVTFAQMVAGLLFFTLGLDHQILQAFARSLSVHPPGQFALSLGLARQVVNIGSSVFSTGLRLVLPVVALLLMVDISLALLARLNSQLQLITLAFPIKMLVSLALLAWLSVVFPKILAQSSIPIIRTVQRLLN